MHKQKGKAMSTAQDLKEAFAGESQANRRYLAFAQQADEDGFPHVARLFRAIAEAETIHAHRHFRVAGGVQSTAENLQTAINGEGYEVNTMYPTMLAGAIAESNKAAEGTFGDALAVEKIHYELYTAALAAVKSGKDIASKPMHICTVCGHTVVGDAPDRCPICLSRKDKFIEVK
jgi:rubrerythrin